MAWTKLDSSLPRSTIWQESSDTRVVWITMLALANRKGIVESSLPGLAHEARVSREAAEEAIAKFLAPDPDSRNPAHEGRRIEPIDGGWLLLNYESYRLNQREIEADKKRRHRAKKAAEKSEVKSVADEAAAMEAARTSVLCPQCKGQLRRLKRKDGTGYVYGHGRGGNGCNYVIGVDEYQAAQAAQKPYQDADF